LVIAAAGKSSRDGTLTINLTVKSAASRRSHNEHALRIYGPLDVARPAAMPLTIVNGPGRSFFAQLLPDTPGDIVPSSVFDTPV
jgi:hypothetical protein